MDRGNIPINKNFELEYRYYDKDANYKYFNRKFEIYLLEKKALRKNYVLHMDNSDISQMTPYVFKASTGKKKHDFGVTTLNWNDIRTKFTDYIVSELGEKQRNNVRKAIGKLSSPKI
jgi:hypothetical protein